MQDRTHQASALQIEEPDFSEKRGAERFALLLRTAKLVCGSGEYLCVVRDVSATGTRLKVFHDLPADRRMALKLANDDFYFIERVWQNGDHAGFRFASDIDVHQFLGEPSPYKRRAIRLGISGQGVVTSAGMTAAASLLNLSQHGAAIEAGMHIALDQQVRLEIEGMPMRHATVKWRRGNQYGLALVESFRFDELAQLAFHMQPLPPTHSDAISAGRAIGCA